jgi:hypothetical protein
MAGVGFLEELEPVAVDRAGLVNGALAASLEGVKLGAEEGGLRVVGVLQGGVQVGQIGVLLCQSFKLLLQGLSRLIVPVF